MAYANHKNSQILVFDSGIGGLSVVSALRKMAPGLSICYVADNAAFPYGGLTDQVLLTRVTDVLESVLDKEPVAAVVIACNTVSTLMLDELRARFAARIFGVVPPIKPAAEYSRNRRIGLLATPATLRQSYIDDLVQSYASDCHVIRVGSPLLAQLAETYIAGQWSVAEYDQIRTILQPLFAAEPVDAVALGCTHYPFLLDVFKTVAPYPVNWFDPAPAVARHLINMIMAEPQSQLLQHQQSRFYFTREPDKYSEQLPDKGLRSILKAVDFATYEILSIPYICVASG